jgi:DNA ligase 1
MVKFQAVAELAEALSHESGRLKKRADLAAAIAAVHRESPSTPDAGLFALYLAGTPFAEADPRKLNVGGALLARALLKVSGATDLALTAAYRRHGDMGAAAFDLLALLANPSAHPQPTPPLTLTELHDAFAALSVARTTALRTTLVEALLARASALEAKYLIKLMLGDMRIGVKQSLVEEAIAAATGSEVAAVRHAVMLEADLAATVARAFSGTLAEARMRLFHPLGFMLASPVETPEEAVVHFTGRFTGEPETNGDSPHIAAFLPVSAFLEDKYDGMRAQLHLEEHLGDPAQPARVALYSRNREDVTESFPELEEAFALATSTEIVPRIGPLILDGEILGWDLATQRALPFTVLSQRIGRKRVGNELRTQIPVIFMVFDLLYADGELLLHHPLRDRRNRLEAIAERLTATVRSPLTIAEPDKRGHTGQTLLFAVPSSEPIPRLQLSPSSLVQSANEIDRAYTAARARANEGIMLKAAGSTYQPGRRGLSWLKLKRELATLDVVITGAEFGHGKRAGILSDYTFAVRGPRFHQTGELLNVGKAYSGLTDAEIADLSAWIKAHTLEDRGHFRTVEPLRILEVAFNNIMRSDRHASGFALRFPRILALRDDKPLDEIDTVARVEEIYQSQVDKPAEQTRLSKEG